MHINVDTWHYKVFAWSQKQIHSYVPTHTNLCTYMRHVFLWPWLIGLVWIVAVAGIGIGVIPFMLLIGRRPTFNDVHGEMGFVRYKTISIRSFNIYPWHVLLPAFVVWMNYMAFTSHQHDVKGVIIGIEAGFAIVLLVFGIAFWKQTSSAALVRSWFDAKTAGVCPLVEFDGLPPDDDEDDDIDEDWVEDTEPDINLPPIE
jgi:hypothetical protein